MSRYKNLAAIGLATMLSFGLVACGGGGGDTPPPPPVEEPTAYETAVDAIQAAETDAAAQKAVDDAAANVSGAQLRDLQAKADARKAALATAASAAEQKMALMDAANMIDTSDLMTEEAVAAANTAIAALKAALAAATDVSDADKAMYQGRVTAAETAVAAARSALDHDAQMMALSEAVSALQDIDLSDLSDQAEIDAANAAIAALRTALDNATELSDAEKTAAMTELATASRTVMTAQGSFNTESQMTMLADAVGALKMVDLDNLMTQAQIDAANEAIIALDLALDAATNLTDRQKLNALTDVTLAKRKVTAAETTLAENVGSQTMALTEAGSALAAIDLADLDTAEKITAANEAVEALEMALANATHLSEAAKAMYQSQLEMADETVKMAQTGMDRDGRMMAQRTAITDAVAAVRTAVAAVNDTATDDQVTAADEAVAALKKALDEAGDLPEGDTDVAEAKGTLTTLEGQLASAKTSRTAAMEAADEERRMAEAEEERKANEARAATAAKLYAAISPASGDNATLTPEARFAEINPVSGDDSTPFININYGGDLETTGEPNTVALNVDKDTPVADHRGWKGNRYVEKNADGKVITEARVYSDEMPTMGAKFNGGETGDGAVGFGLNDAGALVLTGDLNIESRIASSRFTHTAGTHTFELPEDNPGGLTMLNFAGSYYGVAGTYTCTPASGTPCSVIRGANGGYTMGFPAVWTFKPTNPDARVTESADSLYAVYGWWLRTPAGNGAWTAAAFDGYYGTAVGITGLAALNGSATYTGGAAGKYALSSTTGGTNDAGHFTARATLEADFDTDMITGTIDNFMGVGGAKNWSVELMKSAIGATGLVRQSDDDNTDLVAGDPGAKTKWTIGDVAAAASGHWKGNFLEVADTDSDVPEGVPEVVTGDFYSEFGNSGKMVGGFGAKTE